MKIVKGSLEQQYSKLTREALLTLYEKALIDQHNIHIRFTTVWDVSSDWRNLELIKKELLRRMK